MLKRNKRKRFSNYVQYLTKLKRFLDILRVKMTCSLR